MVEASSLTQCPTVRAIPALRDDTDSRNCGTSKVQSRARVSQILRASRCCRLDPRQGSNATATFAMTAIALPGYSE